MAANPRPYLYESLGHSLPPEPPERNPEAKVSNGSQGREVLLMEPGEMPTENHLRSTGAPPCVGYAKYQGLDWQHQRACSEPGDECAWMAV